MLRVSYDSKDAIPEQFRELFTEQDGKWVMTQVQGLKTELDVSRQLEANQKERAEHKKTKALLARFSGLDPETIMADLDELKELRVLKDTNPGEPDADKQAQLIEAAVARKLGPVQRELDAAIAARDEAASRAETLQSTITRTTVSDRLRSAAMQAKLIPSAVEDALLLGLSQLQLTDDGQVMTEDGLTPDLWLESLKEKRPHWWPSSQGAGANGGSGGGSGLANNPWSKANWNLTNQGRYLREHGADKAAKAAEVAGSFVGATKPTEKS